MNKWWTLCKPESSPFTKCQICNHLCFLFHNRDGGNRYSLPVQIKTWYFPIHKSWVLSAYARYCSKCFTNNKFFNHPNNPMKSIILLLSHFLDEESEVEKSELTHRKSRSVRGQARIRARHPVLIAPTHTVASTVTQPRTGKIQCMCQLPSLSMKVLNS